MATVTVRNLSEATRKALKARAAGHDRSMEAEARAILEAAVAPPGFIEEWLEAASKLRGTDLEVPRRSKPREVTLS